jgi:hypothetical protein
MDLGPIAKKSYRLHEQLAKDPNGKSYGYRKVDTYDVTMKTSDIGKGALNIIWIVKRELRRLTWLEQSIHVHRYIHSNLPTPWLRMPKHEARRSTLWSSRKKPCSEGI